MNFRRLYILLILLFPAMTLQAITAEQEQQFKYYWYAARQAITDERYTDAFALLEFCHALQPDDAQTTAFLGVIYDAIGDKQRAAEAFKQAYELSPTDHWQRYLEPLLQQQIQAKQWKQALATQDKIDRYRGEKDAYSALTRYRIYAMWNKPKKAIEAIDDYLETDPTNIRFLLFRLDLMEQTGAKPKALYAMYDKILAVDPYNLMILNNYAYLLSTHKGDLTEAERMSAITIREEPNNPVYLDTYGWILHLKGQDELALFFLRRAWTNADEQNRQAIEQHIHAIQ